MTNMADTHSSEGSPGLTLYSRLSSPVMSPGTRLHQRPEQESHTSCSEWSHPQHLSGLPGSSSS